MLTLLPGRQGSVYTTTPPSNPMVAGNLTSLHGKTHSIFQEQASNTQLDHVRNLDVTATVMTSDLQQRLASSKTLSLSVLFPSVMKMEITVAVTVNEDATLEEVTKAIFAIFWSSGFGPMLADGQEGHPSQLTIKDSRKVVVSTDPALHEALQRSHNFEIVFNKAI